MSTKSGISPIKIWVDDSNSANKTQIIELEDGEVIKCSRDHPLRLINGDWIKACELTLDHELSN